jgi:hypothetical protein
VLAPLLARILSASPRARVLMAHVHRSDAVDGAMDRLFAEHGLRIGLAPRAEGDVAEQDISIIQVSPA